MIGSEEMWGICEFLLLGRNDGISWAEPAGAGGHSAQSSTVKSCLVPTCLWNDPSYIQVGENSLYKYRSREPNWFTYRHTFGVLHGLLQECNHHMNGGKIMLCFVWNFIRSHSPFQKRTSMSNTGLGLRVADADTQINLCLPLSQLR